MTAETFWHLMAALALVLVLVTIGSDDAGSGTIDEVVLTTWDD